MINRVLIRIKVIQILYSFLLVEKRFSLETVSYAATKEKRFALALYLDMLILLIRIAESVKMRRETPLTKTRFISRLLVDPTIRAALNGASSDFPYEPVVEELAKKIKQSALFKNYLKDSALNPSAAEADFWKNVFSLIVVTDPAVARITTARVNFTPKGEERMKEMVHRTFVNFLTSQDNEKEVESALSNSLDRARDLYVRLLAMPVEITDIQERILDENRHKFLKSAEDVNPNLKFVENGLVDILRRNPVIESYLSGNSGNKDLPWSTEDPVLYRKLLSSIVESEDYKTYMEDEHRDLQDDCRLWRNLFKKVILDNPVLLEAMEDKSVFWNDDMDIISTFVLKSFRRVAEGNDPVLDKFKDVEDQAFGFELVKALYKEKDTYRRYIDDALDSGKWDKDRMAFMDIVIMMTALAEIMNFPKIPLQASINEYIEIAKSYSSSKSGAFINGVLGSVIHRLQSEGKLLKR